MKGFERALYGDKIAQVYDQHIADLGVDDPATVATLAEYASDGPVLELGIGTGRVAIPLSQRGIEVHGIDVSEAMLTRLKEKLGGDKISTTLGDFADVPVEGRYSMIYCVFHTFFGLTTQQEQIACFRNVAERLTPGGSFVIEAFVPDVKRFDHGQDLTIREITADRVELNASVHDSVAQRVYGHAVYITEAGIKMYPVDVRYAWPTELDLMARLAGLELRERWGGWRREPFTVASTAHVSLYQKPRA